jgi:hypothetical protein
MSHEVELPTASPNRNLVRVDHVAHSLVFYQPFIVIRQTGESVAADFKKGLLDDMNGWGKQRERKYGGTPWKKI